ncbi:MAG: SPOR domain-containing protein [Bacteroidetes bacterium]|nr:SPOR domain-containing protein [Bacteroidota bacterium]
MNKYLIELIKLQNSVILPGFGALMIGNSKSGKVVFNPHLKFNDGALAKFIVEKEGIDQQAAQNQIAKFVREIEAELGKGNSFDIFQFGKFSKKKDGTIEFMAEAGSVLTTETEPVKPAVKVEKPVAEKTAAPVTTTDKKIADTKAEIKSTPEVTKEAAAKKSESLLDKLKSSEATVQSKVVETEATLDKKLTSAEESASKQVKNSFKPADEKTEAVKHAEKTVEKPAEITKTIPLAEATKKEPAAQVKNVYKPSEELKTEEKLVTVSDTLSGKSTGDDKKPDDVNPLTDKAPGTDSKKKEEPVKKESIKEKFKKDKPQKIKHEDPESKKPKKKKRWVLWTIIIIILGGGGAAGWFYKDQINHFLFAGVGDQETDSTHTQTPVHPEDSLQTEIMNTVDPADSASYEDVSSDTETAEETPVEENVKTEPVVTHTSPGGTYHIIGNSFSSETNAENYVKKMTEKGYSAQNIGKYNGLYLVSLKSFGSRDEAKNNLGSVQSDAAGAYVFKAK